MKKILVSAVLVSRNAAVLLDECLKSISFCDEIVVVCLESTDNTTEIRKPDPNPHSAV